MSRFFPTIATLACLLVSPVQAGKHDAEFRRFLEADVKPAAQAAGVKEATLSRELQGLTPDTSLPGLVGPGGKGTPPKVNFQAEFRAPANYFKNSQFNALVPGGRRLMKKHARSLAAIEERYGVPRRIIRA
ncbi:MAG: lytic murein transglycosylase, partial [Roseibium sp.]|uniref:lytic murein transglycosylase n=1 Tax=Roseibium sp. TaxID=1936156 RepID=UPI00329687EF